MKIRSGDTIELLAYNPKGEEVPVAMGIIDETDCHILPSRIEYVLSGRELIGQLVDHSAVSQQDTLIVLGDPKTGKGNPNLQTITKLLIQNTRIPQEVAFQQIPNGDGFLFQTNPGETKMNALQRYLELANALVWSLPTGQIKVGKPNFIPASTQGNPILSLGNPADLDFLTGGNPQGQVSNILDCRVRRNCNNAIRQIVIQMSNRGSVRCGSVHD